jgi:methyltransferase family protein
VTAELNLFGGGFMPGKVGVVHLRVATKRVIAKLMPAIDVCLSPFVYCCALLLRLIRTAGIERLPHSKAMLLRAGCFPLRDHYYEPSFGNASIRELLSAERDLPGIAWNGEGQLKLLRSFSYNSELATLPRGERGEYEFYLDNGAFGPGDAEYWYNLIRLKRPKRIIEVGSGFSTRLARLALKANEREDPQYACEHILIEPYEHDWLEELGIRVIREKVENSDMRLFESLGEDDILFIDSSHMIRPQGDVLFEYLEILPTLNVGVIVHVHDIFSPKDYPAEWIVDKVRFWNEQYLLEAFLTLNRDWKIIGALNFLRHHHYDELKAKCPFMTDEREPGSFYIQRVESA